MRVYGWDQGLVESCGWCMSSRDGRYKDTGMCCWWADFGEDWCDCEV